MVGSYGMCMCVHVCECVWVCFYAVCAFLCMYVVCGWCMGVFVFWLQRLLQVLVYKREYA